MINIKKFVLVAFIICAMVLTMAIVPGCKTTTAAATTAGAETTAAATTAAAETTAAATVVAGEKAPGINPKTGNPYKFAIVIHETGTPFMIPIKLGMDDAAKLIGVQADFIGPVEADETKKVEMFYEAIKAGYEGLATSINNDEQMDEPIAAAMKAGIPVISTNSDDSQGAKGNMRMATVNQDHYKAGVKMGEYIAKLHKDGDTVLLMWVVAGATPLELRMQGVKDGIAATNPNIKIVGPIAYGLVESDVPNKIQTAYSANPEVNGIYSVDGYSTGIGRFLVNANLVGKVKGGGWDEVQANLEFVKDGTIEFCLGQDPYSQGFYPILMLWLYLEKGVYPKDINTGAEMVDKTNIDAIIAREKLMGSIK